MQFGNLIRAGSQDTTGNLPAQPPTPIKNESGLTVVIRGRSGKRPAGNVNLEEVRADRGEDVVSAAVTRARSDTPSAIGAEMDPAADGTTFAFSAHGEFRRNGGGGIADYGDSDGEDMGRLARPNQTSILSGKRQRAATPTGGSLEDSRREEDYGQSRGEGQLEKRKYEDSQHPWGLDPQRIPVGGDDGGGDRGLYTKRTNPFDSRGRNDDGDWQEDSGGEDGEMEGPPIEAETREVSATELKSGRRELGGEIQAIPQDPSGDAGEGSTRTGGIHILIIGPIRYPVGLRPKGKGGRSGLKTHASSSIGLPIG